MVVRMVQCVASPTVLLDLDGTLVDSATGITEHLSSALADYFEVTAPTRLADRPAPRPDLSPMMVGDRRHEVHGAAAHRLATIGVSWAHSGPDELRTAGAVATADTAEKTSATLLLRAD